MKKTIQIERFKNNPLIEPDQHHTWMSRNVFNCGVVIDNDGLYKMLFRGAWTEDQSMSDLGFATSVDGKEWYVLDKPVLKNRFNKFCKFGIDDPRIVKWIDDWKYIFAAIRPSKEYRTAGIFRTKNFLEYEWVGMPFNLEDVNAAIFPEPINSWAYLLHRKPQHIWISRTKDMSLKSGWQDNKTLIYKDQFYQHPEHDVLPAKIGIAGPPIRTPKGWLLITHVVHRWDKKITRYSFLLNRSYSLSFVVLDLEDPTKVLYIHPRAILWPEERHEIVGTVPNVVFSCATVDTGRDSLHIYWGGADTVICGGRLMKKDLVIKINGKGAPLFPEYR